MEILTGATGITIDRSHFSNVGRDQYNNYTTHNNIFQSREKRKKVNRDLSELSEFTEIKHGDIFKDKDVCYSWRLCSNGKDATEAAVYVAQVMVAGRFGESKFTIKTYRGRKAMKEWRRDFQRCSKDWWGNVPLFGYNKTSVPLLIFHGELVPLAHIEERLVGNKGWFYINLLRSSLGCAGNEVWMDPIKGSFCRGPIGPQCLRTYIDYVDVTIPLDAEFLEGDVLIRYLSSMEYDHWVLNVLSYSGYITGDNPTTNHIQVISGLTNTTIAFNAQNVRWFSTSINGSFDPGQLMPNGATRFLSTDWPYVAISSGGERSSWLSQALSVFQAHQISLDENLSTYELIFPIFRLCGALQKSKCKRERRQLSVPIYLFLLPTLPYSLESFFILHFWSLDPTGQIPLSSDMCKYLGLPFKLLLAVEHYRTSWPTHTYKLIRDYQIARGFNPATTDFVRSLGRPIYEVVTPCERHFQEAAEERNEIHFEVSLLAVNDFQAESDVGILLPSPHCERSCDIQGEDHPEEPDESFSLDSLFDEIQAEGSSFKGTSDSPRSVNDPAQTASSQQAVTKRSLLGTLFAPFTWETFDGSGISALAI